MHKREKFLFNAVIAFFVFCSLNYASEVMIPATQLKAGGGIFEMYFSRQSKTLNFQVSSQDEIKVGATGVSYFSNVSNDLESPGLSNSILIKYLINPKDNLNYWLKAGKGTYELEFPSDTVKNKLSGIDQGWTFGVGVRKRLFPDTIVSPAISIELGLDYASYEFDRFKSDSSEPQIVSNKLDLAEIQSALTISKKYAKNELFGGLKLNRTYSLLWNRTTKDDVSGFKDNVGLFAGLRISPFSGESIVLEAGFLGEAGISAGWSIEF